MADWFISTEGNDSDDGSFENPWATIEKIRTSASVQNGDTIYLIGHAVNTFLPPTSVGAYWHKYLNWRGYNVQNGTPRPVISGSGFTFSIWHGLGGVVTFTDIDFIDVTTPCTVSGFIGSNQPNTSVIITRCRFFNLLPHSTQWWSGVFIGTNGCTLTFESCVIDGFGATNQIDPIPLISMRYTGFVNVLNSIIRKRASDPFAVNYITWAQSTLSDSRFRFVNSIIVNEQDVQFNFFDQTAYQTAQWVGSGNNVIYSAGGWGWNTASPLPPHMAIVPLFWDAENRDFRLRAKDGSGSENSMIEGGVML